MAQLFKPAMIYWWRSCFRHCHWESSWKSSNAKTWFKIHVYVWNSCFFWGRL